MGVDAPAETMFQLFVLLDCSVLLNILATGRADEVLRTFDAGVGLSAAVAAETLFLRGENPSVAPERISLDPLIGRGLLQRLDLETDEEKALYVQLAADLDDGESMTLAIAHHRGMTVATDDRKARRLARQRFGEGMILLRTTDILHAWLANARIDEAGTGAILRRIESIARFRPANDDPLRDWWLAARAW
jgi:predicted nucleic acid-binding protein